MPLPPGITTGTVTFGQAVSLIGGGDTAMTIEIKPTHNVVHAATGIQLLDFAETVKLDEGVPGSITLPHTDQAGFIDAAGNAFSGWAYIATGNWRRGNETRTFTKRFQILTGQTSIDLDLLPNGSITVPVSAPVLPVTSFLGKTGAIEAEDLTDLGVGGGGVADGGVTTAKLATDAVTSDKIASGAVNGPELGQDAVTASKIANDAVARAKLAEEVRTELTGKLDKTEAANSYAPLWQPSTAYALNAPVLLPAPVSAIGKRTTAGTSRASFDATEQGLWTVAAGGAGQADTVDTLGLTGTTGRAVMKAADAATARTAIGAGTSDLALGATASTAKPGDYQPTAATITDLTEYIQDTVAGLIKAGTNVTTSYDDAANTFTINATASGGGTTDPEVVRDTIGGALSAGSGISVTVNDAADTITIAVAGVPQNAVSGLTTSLTTLQTNIDAKYTKPALGIPKADLVPAVQASLGLADNAAPKSVPLRQHMTKRAPLHEVSTEFTQCTVSTTAPTFTAVSYAAGGAALPNYVSMLGGAYSFDFSAYWRNTGLTDNDSPTGALSFMTNANHFCIQSTSFGAGDMKVYADGKPFNALSTGHAIGYGSQVYTDVKFGTRKWRRIDVVGGLPAWSTVLLERTDSIYPAPRPDFRAAIVGDSYVAGSTNPDSAGVSNLIQIAMPEYLRIATGWDICPAGIGGSGYIAGGSTGGTSPYGAAARLDGVVRSNPDLVIVYGSINDNQSTAAEITAAATTYYAALAARLPGVPVVVVGAEPMGNGFEPYDKCNAAVKAAALAAPNVFGFIDMRAPVNWFNGSGKVGTVAGDGNADEFVSADGLHPSQKGNEYLGFRLAQELAKVKAPLISKAAV